MTPDGLCFELPGVLSVRFAPHLDAATCFLEQALADGAAHRLYQRTALPVALAARGLGVLHASAVVGAQGAIGLCGASGAGKSTLACALARRGHAPWADDALVFEPAGEGVQTLAVPFSPRLLPDAAAWLGAPPFAEPPPPATARPLAALVLLARRDGAVAPPRLRRLAPGAAFAALLTHAICLEPVSAAVRRRLAALYLELAAAVPVCELVFAGGLERLEAAERCLAGLVGEPCPPLTCSGS